MQLTTERIGHAYLLEGDTGLLGYANAFAKALNCLREGEAQYVSLRETPPLRGVPPSCGYVACGACISCRVFDSGNHPDTLYVIGSKPTSIGVDDIREQILLPMATKPFNYKYKVFIVDKAETLTPPAQNALLKTIEEPAPYGVFLLLTAQREAMLETIRSRCVTIRADAVQKTPAVDAADLTALRVLTDELLNTAHTQDILGSLALYKKFEPHRETKEFLAALLDMLYEGYGARLRTMREAHAFRATKAIARTKELLSQNANFQLTLELMLLQIGGHVA